MDQSNQSNQRRDDRADAWHGIPQWQTGHRLKGAEDDDRLAGTEYKPSK